MKTQLTPIRKIPTYSCLYFLLLFCVMFSLASCVNVNRLASKATIESKQIPPSMKGADFGLIGIIPEEKNAMRRIMKREFKNHYSGKYMLTTQDKVDSIRMRDPAFKYLLKYKVDEYNVGPEPPMDHVPGLTLYNNKDRIHISITFSLNDLPNNTYFKGPRKSNAIHKALRAYLIAIDRTRKNK